jgi:hypothetical protein
LEEVSNESFYLVDEYVALSRKHVENEMSRSGLVSRFQGGIMLAGMVALMFFVACGAPATHAFCALGISGVAAAAAGEAEPRSVDEEVGERTAATLRRVDDHGRLVSGLCACALLGAVSEGALLGTAVVSLAHAAGHVSFSAESAEESTPVFLALNVLVLVIS